MKHYILNFKGVNSYLEFHERIMQSLDFSDYYGKNLDAFWDCITDMDAPCTIHITEINSLPTDLKEYLQNDIYKILKEAKEWFSSINMLFDFIVE